MVNSPAAGGASVVAVSVILSVVPSGRVKENVIASPGFGLLVTSTVMAAGEPVGPVTVAPFSARNPGKLHPEDRRRRLFRDADLRAGGGRNDQPAQSIRAEIGLVALGHHLLEAGARRHRH